MDDRKGGFHVPKTSAGQGLFNQDESDPMGGPKDSLLVKAVAEFLLANLLDGTVGLICPKSGSNLWGNLRPRKFRRKSDSGLENHH